MITSHPPDVDGITFTGETVTGSIILKAVAPTLKASSMEMGGKNPGIVFEDADLDLAIKELGRSCFLNTGQVCLGTERVYVHESIFDEVRDRLKDYAENELKYGFPDDEGVNFGPVVSDEHRDKVLSYYKLAEEEGATVVTGGGAPEVRRRARRRLLGRAHHLDRPGPGLPHRDRGDLRPGRGPDPVLR